MRALPALLVSLALGCGSSSDVPSFRDGTAPGTPWQLIGAGIPARGSEAVFGPNGLEIKSRFLVLLSNVSHREQYLESVSVYPIGGRTGRHSITMARKKIDKMIEEDEDVEVELVLALAPQPLSLQSANGGRRVQLGILASMRDGTAYQWIVEVAAP